MTDDDRPPLAQIADQVEQAVADVFDIHDTTLGVPGQLDAIRLRGHLRLSSEQAYPRLAERLHALGYTAILRHDKELGLDVLLAVPGTVPQESGTRLWVNLLLFLLTVLATLFVGATWSDQVPPEADLNWVLTHLWVGWPFALSLMTILTGHELGHYFTARYYKVAVSLPYFIPLPVPPLGTMGAFIVMKGRSVNRRQMLSVGAAGPLVGFVLAVPILLLGLSLSTVQPMAPPEPGGMVFMEGNSLLYLFLKFSLFGRILPGSGDLTSLSGALNDIGAALFGTFALEQGFDVFIHPVALAGWAGLLVTAFNLLPVGQLDGGHVLYSLVGQKARLLTWPIVGLLVLMGIFFWQGWLLWAALVFLFGRSHPEPLDNVTPLDMPRKIIALLVLLIFLLTFTPMPMQIYVAPAPGLEPGAVVGLAGTGALSLVRWAKTGQRGIALGRGNG